MHKLLSTTSDSLDQDAAKQLKKVQSDLHLKRRANLQLERMLKPTTYHDQ